MNQQTEDIKAIRRLMEQSSKFMSFNGLSIVVAGLVACAGAAFAYFFLMNPYSFTDFDHNADTRPLLLLADALVVLTLAIASITFFSWRKAKKNGLSLFNGVTWRVAYNLMIPLVAGGIFSLLFLVRGDIGIVAASTLIFYGLALVNVSKFTIPEIHYLGIAQIIVGLLAAVFLYHGIEWWTVGFGVLHIIFGFWIYCKYDKK